jgi:hypothetical protein
MKRGSAYMEVVNPAAAKTAAAEPMAMVLEESASTVSIGSVYAIVECIRKCIVPSAVQRGVAALRCTHTP